MLRRMVAIAMAEVLRPGPMTLEQWADMDEDEPGELVDGVLVEEEVPTNLHELIVSWLLYELMTWAKQHGGHVLGSEHKLGVAARRGRKPDVAVYAPHTKLGWHASLSRVPPLIIVEVISRRARDVRRDRVEKLGDYARFGVRWYWLVDPEARLLEILEASDPMAGTRSRCKPRTSASRCRGAKGSRSMWQTSGGRWTRLWPRQAKKTRSPARRAARVRSYVDELAGGAGLLQSLERSSSIASKGTARTLASS